MVPFARYCIVILQYNMQNLFLTTLITKVLSHTFCVLQSIQSVVLMNCIDRQQLRSHNNHANQVISIMTTNMIVMCHIMLYIHRLFCNVYHPIIHKLPSCHKVMKQHLLYSWMRLFCTRHSHTQLDALVSCIHVLVHHQASLYPWIHAQSMSNHEEPFAFCTTVFLLLHLFLHSFVSRFLVSLIWHWFQKANNVILKACYFFRVKVTIMPTFLEILLLHHLMFYGQINHFSHLSIWVGFWFLNMMHQSFPKWTMLFL